jgi:hypothetical protein
MSSSARLRPVKMADEPLPIERPTSELQPAELPPPIQLTGAARGLSYVFVPPVLVWQALRALVVEVVPAAARTAWSPVRALGLGVARVVRELGREILVPLRGAGAAIAAWGRRVLAAVRRVLDTVLSRAEALFRVFARTCSGLIARVTLLARALVRVIESTVRELAGACSAVAARIAAAARALCRACLRSLRAVWLVARSVGVRIAAVCRVPLRAGLLALRHLGEMLIGIGSRLGAALRPDDGLSLGAPHTLAYHLAAGPGRRGANRCRGRGDRACR